MIKEEKLNIERSFRELKVVSEDLTQEIRCKELLKYNLELKIKSLNELEQKLWVKNHEAIHVKNDNNLK